MYYASFMKSYVFALWAFKALLTLISENIYTVVQRKEKELTLLYNIRSSYAYKRYLSTSSKYVIVEIVNMS